MVSFLEASNSNTVLGSAALGAGVSGATFVNASNPQLGQQLIMTVSVGDFNGDGIPDLLAMNNGTPATVFLGNGDGTFTALPSMAEGGGVAFAVADFNGDGILDLAFANNTTLTVLLGNGDGTFTAKSPALETYDAPVAITVADFNGDGIPDLAIANSGSDTVIVLLGNGD